ncbi:WD40 repeat-like protein [Lentinula detonsa]|uniref:WD40 repeat-like protein n=1 Tax=Lentinula detonsa TaxID=2804962 RepID=A0AA38UWG7_9AGAR|nr:WD40 repeat-like protein [Lentinula detonsa]
MRFTELEESSPTNSSNPAIAGPSSKSHSTSNGRTVANGNGFVSPFTNGNGVVGSSGAGTSGSNGVVMERHEKSALSRVNLPGHLLYEDSNVDREEFVRLLLQSLRDVGYIESAATLEAESGFSMEEPQVRRFREYILSGMWSKAEDSLSRLGIVNEDNSWDAKFLINKQKYLELLEARKTAAALHVLRTELALSSPEPAQLHVLASLLMCTEPEDVRQRAGWDGVSGQSRQQLLLDLHRFIPSSVMIPQRRFLTLLQQARQDQLRRCIYHNTPLEATPFSLLSDHECNKDGFPGVTTTVLSVHTDEVWNVEWSHDGAYLASGSADRTAIIWNMGSDRRKWEVHLILGDHPFPVHSIAWSSDDSMLLTGAEHFIKLWDAKTGSCIRTMDEHTETVTALSWLPDGSGFISGALDRKIIQWDAEGRKKLSWGLTDIRVTDLAVTPDLSRVVTIGMHVPTSSESSSLRGIRNSGSSGDGTTNPSGNTSSMNGITPTKNRFIIYRLSTRQVESSIKLDGDLTSVKVSQDSQYALINHSPDEIQLWDLRLGRLARKFTGQRQGRHIIRSCFGGIDGSFVASGSEDGNVYVWHRDTGSLLEVLSGHGEGSVNSVAWNPANERMFASCSDDKSIRIWEAPTPEMVLDMSGHTDYSVSYSAKGKGKTRQMDGEVENAGMASPSTRL